jgi:hypothetical protein
VTTVEIVKVDPTTWRDGPDRVRERRAGLRARRAERPYQSPGSIGTGRRSGVCGEPANHIGVALSADGSRAVFETQTTPNADLWIHQLARRLADPHPRPIRRRDVIRCGRAMDGASRSRTKSVRDSLRDPASTTLEAIPRRSASRTLLRQSPAGPDPLRVGGRTSRRCCSGAGVYPRASPSGQLWRMRLRRPHGRAVLPAQPERSGALHRPDGRWIAISSLTQSAVPRSW